MFEDNFRIANLTDWKKYKKIKTATKIILHDTGVKPEQSPKIIDDYHKSKNFKNGIGYDVYINDNGLYETRRLWNNLVGAHTRGHNLYSIGVCVSGLSLSPKELYYLKQVLDTLLSINPNLRIWYHKELSKIRRDPFDDVVKFIEENYAKFREKKGRIKKMSGCENELTKSVLTLLAYNNIFAWRQNNGGVYDPSTKRYRANSSMSGVPDIIGILPE